MSHTYHFPNLWKLDEKTTFDEKLHQKQSIKDEHGKDKEIIYRKSDIVVTERHDIVLLFDATNCNPNGDPDTGNMPRLQPDTLRGLVTDVCLKRKVRNFFARHSTNGDLKGEGHQPDARYHLFIREGAVIQTLVEAPELEQAALEIFKTFEVEGKKLTDEDWKKANKKSKKKEQKETEEAGEGEQKKKRGDKSKNLMEYRDRAFRNALCRTYFDVRYFGQVVSTEGPLKGSFYGQIRGPLQVTFGESLDKILQLDFSITRCAVANEKEAEKKDDDNRTMGRKHAVPYGLYRCHIHFSPAFAAKTGFTYADLDNFLFALTRCLGDYNVDGSSARPGGMRVVGLVDFQHKDALGNAPAHKLFELVKVRGIKVCVGDDGKPVNPQPSAESEGRDAFAGKWVFQSTGSEFPQGLQDYTGTAPDGPIYVQKNNYEQVTACVTAKPPAKDGNEPVAAIIARRIIWEIPEVK
jgi:CRISPR-associated protein Csd2